MTGETGLEYDLQILIFLFVLQQFHLKGHQPAPWLTQPLALSFFQAPFHHFLQMKNWFKLVNEKYTQRAKNSGQLGARI